jgi:P-type Mg2+ transporter
MAGKPPTSAERGPNDNALLTKAEILTLPPQTVLDKLGTNSDSGLSSEEAARRLKEYGPNEVVNRRKGLGIGKFLSYFRNPLIIILLLAGTITLFTGEAVSAVVIYIIVAFSTVLTYAQEYRAEKASVQLSQRVSTTVTMVRDGEKKEGPLADLVPGDIVHLTAGDLVPADCRAISCRNLFIDQSTLTGESMAVEKSSRPIAPDKVTDSTEWSDYLFMGTSVVNGSAVVAVVSTGTSTSYAQIVQRLVQRRPETEFEKGSRRFGYLIMRVTFVLVAVVFLINALYQRSLLESLLFAVALAVGLTPELLPLILTINLSEGALDMSHKGVIVKRLEAIQNYGSMDVLCTDKTGTLTQNKVALVQYVGVRGKQHCDLVLRLSYLNSAFETGLKSQLDNAILAYGGVDISGYSFIEELPFDFERRRVSVIVRHGSEVLMITKGAPEGMFQVSSHYDENGTVRELDPALVNELRTMYERMSADGLRLLGVGYKKVEDREDYGVEDEKGLVFTGFVAFLDPPKESAREALQQLTRSGISTKIITGDSELVTRKVCSELGFEITGTVLGSDLERMDEKERRKAVEGANIFARLNPAQKNDVILALKANGHVVGYLGDGVNDATSIRAADVGISVDNAVDVAKESADIILLKNDLRVLNSGVLDGRKTFGNTMKYIKMGISSNFGNMFSAAGASLFLPFLPMLPLQILLNNLLYDLSETTIPTDNVDDEYTKKPKKLDVRYIQDFMLFFGPISSLYDFLTFFFLIFVFNATDTLFQTAWFVESIVTQTLVVFAIRTQKTPFLLSRPSLPLVLSSLAVVAFALLVPYSPLAVPFQLVYLPVGFYIFLAGAAITYLILVDALKVWFYRRHTLDFTVSEQMEEKG